jgi:signal transduction histidine kinase
MGFSKRAKNPIQRKIATFILLVGMFPIVVGTTLVYFQGRKELTESVGKNFAGIAKEIASNIEVIVSQSIYNVESLSLSPILRDAAKVANRRYLNKDERIIEKEIKKLDLEWVQAMGAEGAFKKYLKSPTARYLAEVKEQTKEYEELFITDKRGILAASASNTKYIYFGNEEWWQAAYNDGKGDKYASEIYLDPDKSLYLIRIAAPIMDEGGENLIGIIHAVNKIDSISQIIQKFRVGRTGHAMLINSSAIILLCPIFPPQSHRVTGELMSDINRPSKGWMIVKDNAHGGINAVAGFAPINPAFQKGGKAFGGNNWYIFVSQSPVESYEPINTVLKRIVSLLIFSVAILSAMGFWAARRIVKPIHILQRGAEIIGEGNLNHRIDIKTGDEIEDLAVEFNRMVEKINESYSGLEKRVSERTEELKKSYQEMETISRLKSEFLTNMSHELRTPLNSILGFSEMLYEGLSGELTEKQLEYSNYIYKSGKHLLELINDILDLSKIEAGKMELKPVEFSVRRAIEEVQSIVTPMAMKKKISVGVAIESTVSTIVADQRMFKQIMYNLLSNAVKFTNEGGHIDVNGMSNNYFLQVSVVDNGKGIKKEDKGIIFKEFKQANGSTTRGYEGTGLGLALTKRYVEMQGGSISVESEYGQGSNFTFRLPVDITTIAPVSSRSS